MFLASIAVMALVPSVGAQHPQSLIQIARDNGGEARQSIDLMLPMYKLPDLAKVADLVLQGQVQSVRVRLSTDESVVLTEYQVTLQRVFKGPDESRSPQRLLGDRVQVVQLGGSVNVDGLSLSTRVDEYPSGEVFAEAERVVLFLVKSPLEPNAYTFAAGPYGAFRLRDGTAQAMTRRAAENRGDRPEAEGEFLARVATAVRHAP